MDERSRNFSFHLFPRPGAYLELDRKKDPEPEVMMDVTRAPHEKQLSPARLADRFIRMLGKTGYGKTDDFEESTRFQNVVARGVLSGSIPSLEPFLSELKLRVGQHPDAPPQRDGKPISSHVERYARGIRSLLETVEKVKKTFHKESANTEQMIGLNDHLDTSYGIDLVEIRYDQNRINKVYFIQVKSGRLNQEKREKIVAEHQRFINGLANRRDIVERTGAKRLKEKVRRGEGLLIPERLAEVETPEGRLELITSMLEALLFDFCVLPREERTLSMLERLAKEHEQDGCDALAVKMFFDGSGYSRQVYQFLADGFGLDDQTRMEVLEWLESWQKQAPLSIEEIQSALQDDPDMPEIFDGIEYVSVIYSESPPVRYEQPLYGMRKALTRSK